MTLHGDTFDGIGECRMRWCTAINLVAMLYTGSLGLIASVLVASVVVVVNEIGVARRLLGFHAVGRSLPRFLSLKSKLDYAS